MLGQRLVANSTITAAQLQAALEEQRASGGLLGDVLLKLSLISEDGLSKGLAQEAGVPFMVIDGMRLDRSAVALVPEPFARKHLVAPLGLNDAGLEILQVNPFDVLTIDELERLAGHPAQVVCGTRSDVLRMIERSYGECHGVGDLVTEGLMALEPGTCSGTSGESPVARLVDKLLNDAIARGATDLHVEPEENVLRLRYRVDGVLMAGDKLPAELHASLVSRMKVIAGLDGAEQRLPQEGRFSHEMNGRRFDLRVSSFPTIHGERIAVRILEKDKLIRGLEDLGFGRRNLALFRDVLNTSRGIVLMTGPTGAGKTTTLYSALAYLSGREKNILTVEDPVEYDIPAIRQTHVRPKEGFTRAAAIRLLLRQDPDVIMVDEIGDPETAQWALRAALSGVLVFSTLHTTDSAGAVPRLMDMGLEPYLLASGVVAVIAQRLVRVICPHCKAPAAYTAEVLNQVGLTPDPDMGLYRGHGCERCRGAGYSGRVGVFEILMMDAEMRSLVRERADSRLIKAAAVKSGMKSLMEDALSKAIFGQTTIEEVLRVAYE